MKQGDRDVLLIVDLQNDFCPGGSLAVPLGDEIVPMVNRLAADFQHVILTQDWHPHGHASFASSHPGKQPFDIIEAPYGEQILWPDHCVQGTKGAAFHPDLDAPHAELIVRKGFTARDRLLFGIPRERSSNADGSRRLPEGTRVRAPDLMRSRHRFLRAL